MGKSAGGTENSPKGKAAKVALRRRVLEWIGPESANVFEGYAGNGAMWRAVWREAGKSVGVDRRVIWDPSRVIYIAEVERLMRAIDLAPFNVFDLDAFGPPWPTAYVMAQRRKLAPGERLAVILTDGGRRKAMTGGFEKVMAHLAGVDSRAAGTHGEGTWTALTRGAAAGLAKAMGGRVVWEQIDGGHGANGSMTYSAFGLEGRKAA